VRRYFSLTPVQVGGRTRYRETPFAGTARPGDVLLVRLSAAGSTDWRYLMIEDPLPAGTEAIAEADLYPSHRRRGATGGGSGAASCATTAPCSSGTGCPAAASISGTCSR
jgi:hypothetical protein